MFSFDEANLPKIQRRIAFIGVDFQKDFTDSDGALAAVEPQGFVERSVKLAEAFRSAGADVIWAQSRFDKVAPLGEEQVLASDQAPPRGRPSQRRLPQVDMGETGPVDDEAFLSHEQPTCLRASTTGCETSEQVAKAKQKSDIEITKTRYSAFNGTHLLRILRSKMVMELYICGSLANVGVYATAIDAAGHGISITVIDDCCGYRSMNRQATAFAKLVELTGCDVESADSVREALMPSRKSPAPRKTRPTTSAVDGEKKAAAAAAAAVSQTNDESGLIAQMDSLALNGKAAQVKASDLIAQMDNLELNGKAAKVKANTSTKPPVHSAGGASRVESSPDPPSVIEPDSPAREERSTKSNHGEAAELESKAPAKLREKANSVSEGDSLETKTLSPGPTNGKAYPQANTKSTVSSDKAKVEAPEPAEDESSDSTDLKAPQKGLCSGDTDIIEDVLSGDLAKTAFAKLKDEVDWQRMSHQGGEVPRLVAVQGQVGEDGSIPVYRHPSDESPPLLPFTPTVLAIKAETEKHLGHPLNHVLIQFYRDGRDYISEHSDKTIDVVKDSYIANVSLGAQRIMVLRSKRQDKDPSLADISDKTAKKEGDKPNASNEKDQPLDKASAEQKEKGTGESETPPSKRQAQRAILRHNSLCRMGLMTNRQWLHAIRQDKRPEREKTSEELAFGGARISLTFRRIGTFLNRDETLIWGQGATGKTRGEAKAVINGQVGGEAVAMLRAFGLENHSAAFDWDAQYGGGFDVLHMSSSPRFFAGGDAVVNNRVRIMLAEYGVGYARGSLTGGNAVVKFVDNDPGKSTVEGDAAIMLYLDAWYAPKRDGTVLSRPGMATKLSRFQRAISLLQRYRTAVPPSAEGAKPDLKLLKEDLAAWDVLLTPKSEKSTLFASGDEEEKEPSLVDFALWPVLHDIVCRCGRDSLGPWKGLGRYHDVFAARDRVKKALGAG